MERKVGSRDVVPPLLQLHQQADFLTKHWAERGKRKKRQGGGASGFLHAVPSTSIQLAGLFLNQTAWLVLVFWVLTPPLPAPEPSCSASFLFVWLKTWPFFTPRRHTGRDAGGEEEKHKREGQRGGWRGRRQRERHWTLPSWDWFTSLTEITSLTYKPEVKISH